MSLKSSEIVKADHPNLCAFYSIINFLKLRGVEPPSYGLLSARFRDLVMEEGRQTCRPYIGDGYGMLPSDQLTLLAGSGIQAMCAVSVLPESPPPHEILVPLLASGCHLILGYTFRHPSGRLIPHSVVVEGYCRQGYRVINSDPGYEEGEVIDLDCVGRYAPEEWAAILERYKTATHGQRNILPFVNCESPSNPTGLHDFFVFAYPQRQAALSALCGLTATLGGAVLAGLKAKVKERRRPHVRHRRNLRCVR